LLVALVEPKDGGCDTVTREIRNAWRNHPAAFGE
jgi:hypothetical protein